MKKLLITGANSYIGTSFEKYINENHKGKYEIDTLDMIDPNWVNYDFSTYDTVFHVAGIAHADVGNVSEETKQLYYKVNTDLTIETAKKAKESGVKQFIFMSSMIIYGGCKETSVSKDTNPEPANFYGDSKLQADLGIQKLNDDKFKVCVLRPPMIYGPNSKGNYPMLAKLAIKLPVFPNVKNQRSMLFVGNLCYFIEQCIRDEKSGIFFPQNKEYVSTSLMVKEIAKVHNKKIFVTSLLNPFVFIASHIPGKISQLCNKAFGNMIYEKEMLVDEYDFVTSIRLTEEVQ